MLCVNCGYKKTAVTNSRPSKKTPSIWRRRQCAHCGAIFTTREEVAEEHERTVTSLEGAAPFSLPRLSLSLYESLRHRGTEAPDDAYWLAKTVRAHLSGDCTSAELAETAHRILERFDAVAALHYGSRHRLITPVAKPRRGRPRTSRRS